MLLLTLCKVFIFAALYAFVLFMAYKLTFFDRPTMVDYLKFMAWFHGILFLITMLVGSSIYIDRAGWRGQNLPKPPAESVQ